MVSALGRTRAESTLQEREWILNNLAADIPYQGVLIVDDDMQVHYANDSARDVLGLKDGDLLKNRQIAAACERLLRHGGEEAQELLAGLLAIVCAFSAPIVVAAAEPRPGVATIEEVVVTARRREESVQETPGDEGVEAGRLALAWTPGERTSVDLTLDYTNEREDSAPTTLVQFEPAAGLAPLWNALVGGPSGLTMSTDFISDNPYETFGTGPNHNELEAWGVGLTIEHDFDTITFKSVTAYREMDAVFGRDGDGSPISYVHTDQQQLQDQFSQEFQLSGSSMNERLHWVAGVFYFEEFGRDDNDVRLASGLFDALEALPGALICLGPGGTPPCAGGMGNPVNAALDLDFDIFNEIDITSYAVFGHATLDFSDRWSLNFGLRYSYEEKDYTLEHLRVNAGVPIVPRTVVSDDWGELSPKIGLDFQLNDNALLYGSISRGFKSGGFNGRPTVAAEVEPFEPEFVTTYEVGFKSDLAGRRFRLNGALFFNDYEDIQIGSVSADSTGNLVLVIDNAAKAEVWGAELEFIAQLSRGFSLSGGIGLLDAEYKDVGNATDITRRSEFVKTPEFTAILSAEYEHALGRNGVLIWRADANYTSEVFHDVQNTPSIAEDDLTLVNARIAYLSNDGQWEAALFATNLTDEEYIANGLQALASFGTAEAVYGPPRQWGASVKRRF
eukprot:g16282.t1